MGVSKVAWGKVAAPVKTKVEGGQSWNNVPFAYLTGVMVLLTLVSIFHVWSRVEVIDLNLKISDASRQFKEAQQENKRLKVEVASLKAPARIEALAKGELGMALPTDQQVIVVR
ncbi:cell division protein FtsL [Geomesophilobacter sediminis]|uniref:Cell division protein FtsL n=1 Tax=Geomesophilobacter sediminis TaxID=2798584 RepID=A0A8J7M131_9BACT|nr:cell division protein FtsL [Geomesophilobacter sediminis]MBJ6726661.1 cell division protein FtsL [Geomesophilobacter sediminis]